LTIIDIKLINTGIINIPARNTRAVPLSVASRIPNIDMGGNT
jgi:hypothetical protein